MTLNLLCVLTKENTITKDIFKKGLSNLLNFIFSNNKKTFFFIEDYCDKNFVNNKFDALIFCDPYWLQYGFENSKKYKNLIGLFESFSNTKKFFLGIGSKNHSEENNSIFKTKSEISAIRKIHLETSVSCRDSFTQKVLKNAGINSVLLPCVSYFCDGLDDKILLPKKDNVLIWHDPRLRESQKEYKFLDLLNYYKINQYYSMKYNAKVFCFSKKEIESALKLGINKPIILNNRQELLNKITLSKMTLSGDVYSLIPAMIQRCKVGVIDLSNEVKIISDFGCGIVKNIHDFTKMQSHKIDLKKQANYYKILFQDFLSLCNLQENNIPCL